MRGVRVSAVTEIQASAASGGISVSSSRGGNAESPRYVQNFCLDMVATGGDCEMSGVEAIISSNLRAEDSVQVRGDAHGDGGF